METTRYRAAGWVADDGSGDVRLTTEDQQHLSDDELIKAAMMEAENIGLNLEGGEIKIGEWTDQ